MRVSERGRDAEVQRAGAGLAKALPVLVAVLVIAASTAAVADRGGWWWPSSGSRQLVAATTVADLRTSLLDWLTAERAAAGLVPLRADGVLASLATIRATNLAVSGVLSHEAAGGSVGDDLAAQGYRWYLTGEVIGFTTATWGRDALSALEAAWAASGLHRQLLLSDRFNYVGVGIAHRDADGSTWASVVMAEAPDHTPPVARIVGRGRVGTTIRWRWWGTDPVLQTHTAGLATFDVQYRVDGGPWRTIRASTTTTSLVLRWRPVGHTYWLRVRARDRQGTLSVWSRAVGIRVP